MAIDAVNNNNSKSLLHSIGVFNIIRKLEVMWLLLIGWRGIGRCDRMSLLFQLVITHLESLRIFKHAAQ